jgi:hypothetical protein
MYTYRELAKDLSDLTDAQLDQPVVHVVYGDVVTPVVCLFIAPADCADGLVEGQLALSAEKE